MPSATLQPAAPHLLGRVGKNGEAEGSEAARSAWAALPKLEMFARELRPDWHSVGNEAIHFAHSSFHELRSPESDECRATDHGRSSPYCAARQQQTCGQPVAPPMAARI